MAERFQEERGPDLRDYWRIIVEGRWYIILSFVVVLTSTAFFTFTADPVYQASGKILVLTNRGKAMGESSSTLNIPSSLSGDIRNEVPNWIEIMNSRAALEKALANLRADPQFAKLGQARKEQTLFGRVAQAFGRSRSNPENSPSSGSEEGGPSLTVKELQGRIAVSNVRGTDLIEIKATGGSPLEAKLITNALLSAYVEMDAEITKTSLTSLKEFLKGQVEKTQESLRSAEEQFAQFKQEANLELGLDQLQGMIVQLEQSKAQVEIDLMEKNAGLQALNDQLAKVEQDLLEGEISPMTSGTGANSSGTEATIAQLHQLQGEIKALEDKRIQYLEAGDYDQAQEMENEILARKQSIEQLAQGEFAPFGLLPRYESLMKQQMELYTSIDTLQGQIEAFQKRIDRETEVLMKYSLPYQRFERDIQVNQDLYTMLSEEYEKARIADIGGLGGIRIVSQAVEPDSPIKPKKKVNLILGALVGLTIGAGFAFLKEYLDNTYKTPKQVEQALGIPSLGTVFAVEHERERNGDRARQIRQVLITKLDAKDPFVNAHIGIEASLRFASVDRPLETFMVTSAIPEEGKSSLVANLGLVFSHVGRPTVIVDSDLRKPIFHRIFGLDREVGLTNVALGEMGLEEALVRPYLSPEGKAVGRGLAQLLLDLGKVSRQDLEEALKIQQRERLERSLEEILIDRGKLKPEDLEEALAKRGEGLENFYVLPPGPQPLNPTDFLGSERMKALIEQLKERFEVVLFDSPPVVSVPDATVLSSQVDGVILVIAAERTDKGAVAQAVEQLNKAGANIVGVVLNRVKRSTARYYGGYYGYYYSYYGYGEGKGRD